MRLLDGINWDVVADYMRTRTATQCRLKWCAGGGPRALLLGASAQPPSTLHLLQRWAPHTSGCVCVCVCTGTPS